MSVLNRGQRRLKPCLFNAKPTLLPQRDQPAEPPRLLGGVVGVNIGEKMIEEWIAEPFDHAVAIGERFIAKADPGEDRQHFGRGR